MKNTALIRGVFDPPMPLAIYRGILIINDMLMEDRQCC